MRLLYVRYATRNFALAMVVNRTSSVTWKKKRAIEDKASNNNISNYLSTNDISEMVKQLSLVAQEATLVYQSYCSA
jgi:hypothetical protein